MLDKSLQPKFDLVITEPQGKVPLCSLKAGERGGKGYMGGTP